MAEADRALVAIQETPTGWPFAPGSKVARRFVFKRFPYVAYYRIRDNDIWVVAFAHTSRQPGYWMHRLKPCQTYFVFEIFLATKPIDDISLYPTTKYPGQPILRTVKPATFYDATTDATTVPLR